MSAAYEAKATAALERLGLTVALSHLDAVCQQAAAEDWSYSHFLGYLLDGELVERHRRTVALNLQFENKQQEDAYQVHPLHLEFVEKAFKPNCARVVIYDFE